MTNNISNSERDIECWKKLSSRLALALTATFFASGVICSWMSFENKSLKAFVKTNDQLRNAITRGRETLAEKSKEVNTSKKKIKELQEELDKLNKTDAIKALNLAKEELQKSEIRVKELSDKNLKLIVENAELKTQLENKG